MSEWIYTLKGIKFHTVIKINHLLSYANAEYES